MNIVIDAREYNLFDLMAGRGTELVVRRLADGLAGAGHRVDVITPAKEHRRTTNGVYWWPDTEYPKACDVLIACEHLRNIDEFSYDRLFLRLNRIDSETAGRGNMVEKAVCLSPYHRKYLLSSHPDLKEGQIEIIPHGVDPRPRRVKVPGRIIWCNSPDRGLVHMTRMWPKLKELAPHASLVITYDFDFYFEKFKYIQDELAMQAWEIKKWIDSSPDVQDLGGVASSTLAEEQAKAELFVYPCDPPGFGSVFYSISVMECAAAGCGLILADQEALLEEFGDIAVEVIGLPINDDYWAERVAHWLNHPKRMKRKRQAARQFAEARSARWEQEQWVNLVNGVS